MFQIKYVHVNLNIYMSYFKIFSLYIFYSA